MTKQSNDVTSIILSSQPSYKDQHNNWLLSSKKIFTLVHIDCHIFATIALGAPPPSQRMWFPPPFLLARIGLPFHIEILYQYFHFVAFYSLWVQLFHVIYLSKTSGFHSSKNMKVKLTWISLTLPTQHKWHNMARHIQLKDKNYSKSII
jgi:hypothetical protein